MVQKTVPALHRILDGTASGEVHAFCDTPCRASWLSTPELVDGREFVEIEDSDVLNDATCENCGSPCWPSRDWSPADL